MRRILIIIVIILAILIAWFFLKPSEKSPVQTNVSSNQVKVETRSQNKQPEVNSTNQASTDSKPKIWAGKNIEGLDLVAKQMNVPIEFFGKVLDQDENPLDQVIINVKVSQPRMTLPGEASSDPAGFGAMGYKQMELTTDMSGKFHVSGVRGSIMNIESIEKKGYELSKKEIKSFFSYYDSIPQDRFVSDPQNPVIYRMWKKGEPEVLVHLDKHFAIPYDGTPVIFDLIQGSEVTDGGDLKVTLLRTPQQIKWGENNFSWEASVEAVDGGLVLSEDEFMYRAPEDGYQPRTQISMKLGDPKWTDTKALSLYLKSRGGKYYSRVRLEFITYYDKPKTPLKIVSYLNPMGSRNLEYDFNKRIDPSYIQRVGLEKAIEEVKGR